MAHRAIDVAFRSEVGQARFKAFDDFEDGIIAEGTLSKVLHLLVNYSIRRLICEVGSNSLRGLYKTLYSRVFNREENKEHYYDAIVSFLTQMNSKDAIPNDEEFILALKEKNLYRKNVLCKYLLAAVENQGKEKVQTADLSIEHIMSQNKNLSRNWQNMLGDNWEQVHERYLHTLDNLTLTGYNSELGDKSFEEKKQIPGNPESPTHITVLYSDVLTQTVWNESAIQLRTAHLSEMILKLFPVEKAKEKIDFSDPRYREYKVTDSKTATFKQVNYYEFLGEKVNVESFAAMVRSVSVKLYDMDNTVIVRMARDNVALPGWSNPVFSYDRGAIKGGIELKKGTGIYISTGYSAYDCISFIRGLLKKHDLKDFVYSARSTKSESDDTP